MNRDKLLIILGGALFISLTANLFAAGILFGRSYESGRGPDARRAEWQKKDEELRKKLSESDKKIIKAGMQQQRGQFHALKDGLDAARQKVEDAQMATPFDQAALDAALKAEQEKRTALLEAMRKAREDISAKLSPEGRETFNKLGPGSRFGGGKWRGRGGGEWGGGDRGGEKPFWRRDKGFPGGEKPVPEGPDSPAPKP
ncbi:MAG: periplasmic heavy metal sensor [Alphaproteobacteria bacterium]|nr:MAG: periplasmic heavy metal sensor [Alphaproteobacteria bacterium]